MSHIAALAAYEGEAGSTTTKCRMNRIVKTSGQGTGIALLYIILSLLMYTILQAGKIGMQGHGLSRWIGGSRLADPLFIIKSLLINN